MKRLVSAALIAALTGTSSLAQEAMTPATQIAPSPAPEPPAPLETDLPANTELLLSVNSEVTSTTHRAGDTFSLSVVQDVRIGDQVVIPRGSRAVAEITWRTGRGAFGKSGKMNLAMRYVEVDGLRIPIEGTYRQEGEGNTLATVGGVILAGVFAGFITGSRARIPAGRELAARTAIAVPFVSQGGRVRIASTYGAQLDTWRTAQASSPEGLCRAQSEPRSRGDQERLANLIQECLERGATQQTATRR